MFITQNYVFGLTEVFAIKHDVRKKKTSKPIASGEKSLEIKPRLSQV